MDLDSFTDSLDQDSPPTGLAPVLNALWYQAKGDWHEAHRLAQAQRDGDGAWVHAFLHRAEGNIGNADYWYRRAGKTRPEATISDEWRQIVVALLSQRPRNFSDSPLQEPVDPSDRVRARAKLPTTPP